MEYKDNKLIIALRHFFSFLVFVFHASEFSPICCIPLIIMMCDMCLSTQWIIFVCDAVSSIAHVNCGQCQTVLMYPYGAPSVKCAICNFITNTGMNTMGPSPPTVPILNETPYTVPSTSAPTPQPQNVTVVVENPMTVDEKGKLVSNVVVGVTTGGKK
ncbi:hypothetical protein ABZP36_010483 [Zizania latifolia]